MLVNGLVGLGQGAWFAPGRSPYEAASSFETNELTTSRARMGLVDSIAEHYPEQAVGGPSNRWVLEALRATQKIRAQIADLETPTLVFSAPKDTIARAEVLTATCKKAGAACKSVSYPEGKHSLLMETDAIRSDALKRVLAGFKARSCPSYLTPVAQF